MQSAYHNFRLRSSFDDQGSGLIQYAVLCSVNAKSSRSDSNVDDNDRLKWHWNFCIRMVNDQNPKSRSESMAVRDLRSGQREKSAESAAEHLLTFLGSLLVEAINSCVSYPFFIVERHRMLCILHCCQIVCRASPSSWTTFCVTHLHVTKVEEGSIARSEQQELTAACTLSWFKGWA